MSAILLVHGTIRQADAKTKRGTAEVFGTEVAVLTEVGMTLGETLQVMVFTPRPGEAGADIQVGRMVTWVVEVESSQYGLRARFRHEATADDLRRLDQSGLATFDTAAASGF